MAPQNEQGNVKEMIEENSRLLKENNKYLRKLYRQAVWSFWVRIIWYVLLIGLPFALYFYILEPYFELLGSSYQEFSEGIAEIPGWKQLNLLIESMGGSEEGVQASPESLQ